MPRSTSSLYSMVRLLCLVIGATAWPGIASLQAQVVLVPSIPQIGSSNPASAEPLVTRPATSPCIVPLFQNLAFADFNLKSFSYTPPAACPGPWAKVVFTADFTVTAGRQYDRTAAFYLNHANIYFGTTAEPRKALSPSWHVERDVTDLSAIFKTAQTGEANIGNFVGVSGGVDYNGIIYANAALEFYPTSPAGGAPVTPDIVVPVNGTGGDAGTLNTAAAQITQTLNLPRNVERLYLDVIAQSQSSEEQWFFCVPSSQDVALETYCGNTAFRETEISVDGKPAGVAPVSPWIYTGGLDPYLWEPITGLQTLDFKPYRVDLTPFAGLLSDGNTHTVAISVYNAFGYFVATANLFAYQDKGGQQVTGGIVSNTLMPPAPQLVDNVRKYKSGPTYTGGVNVTSDRSFTIAGYVNTSHGRVDTTLQQSVKFKSAQQFNVSPLKEMQHTQQTSTVDSTTTTKSSSYSSVDQQHFAFPITLDYLFVSESDGTYKQTVSSDQKYQLSQAISVDGTMLYANKVEEAVNSTDTWHLSSSFSTLGISDTKSTADYKSSDSLGHCYNRTLVALDLKLTSVSNGLGCVNSTNQ